MLIRTFDTSSEMARAAAAAMAAALNSVAQDKSDRIVLAVAGGSTARLVLPVLAGRSDVPWKRIIVTLVDERWVPVTHAASNQALVSSRLAGAVMADAFLWVCSDGATPEAAVGDLCARIPVPDVVLLGMGDDGHIASLFPGDAANRATGRVTAVRRPDFPRITMTPTTLRGARHIILAFDGAAKRAVFERARLHGAAEDLPVRHLFVDHTQVFVGQ